MKTTQIIKITLMLPLVAVLMFSCRKDELVDPPIDDPSDTTQDTPLHQKLNITDISLEDTSCHDLGGNGDGGNWTVYESAFQYKTPCFNPNNSDEFIFFYKNYQDGIYQLVKYNLQTEQKTIVKGGFSTITSPKWGTNDQIVFNPNYNVSIMNSDGSGETQISSATSNLYPELDANCENVYWQHSPVLGHPYYLVKTNLQTGVLDTVMYSNDPNYGYARRIDISTTNKLICETLINNSPFIAYSSINSINFQGLVDTDNNDMQSLTDVCWHPNGEDFFFTVANGEGAGLYKMNINNFEEATKLVSYCASKHYVDIDCDPSGQYLIGERKVNYVQNNKVYSDSKIYKIDLNTLEETKIDLE